MAWLLTPCAGAACAAWLFLLFCRGGFWRADQRLPPEPGPLLAWPDIMAVIPARNEADVIGRAIHSLLVQDYPAHFSLVLVDDHSDDDTAEIARAAAAALGRADRLAIISSAALPAGWMGKMWAVNQGIAEARRLRDTPYVLLSDADIEHEPGNLRRLVALAETERRDLVSLMVHLHCRSSWERLLIPAFVFFFQLLYPFPLVNRRGSDVAAAAGGCMLVRSRALERIGGVAAIHDAIIDDCALARLIKTRQNDKGCSGAIWLGLSERTRSLRPYNGLRDIWGMVARTAYTQLRRSPVLLIGAMLPFALVFLAPPALLAVSAITGAGLATTLAGLAWVTMAACYGPTMRIYGEPVFRTALLPLAAAFYFAMTFDSARRHWLGRGGAWKGRTCDETAPDTTVSTQACHYADRRNFG